ncbi:MAG: hypothetical protein U0Z53_16895 [Blastocatellia bacterium]
MKSSAPLGSRDFIPAQSSRPDTSSLTLAGPVTLVLLIVLAIIFFAYREADVMQLPLLVHACVTSLLHEPVVTIAGAGRSLAGLVIALLMVLAWYGAGDLIVTLARRIAGSPADEASASFAFETSRRCAFGAGAWSLLWFVAGLLNLYRWPVAVVSLLAGLALFARSVPQLWQAFRLADHTPDQSNDRIFRRVALVIVIFPVLLALVAALAPPTGKDALIYHLALPKAFLAAGGLADVPGNIANYYALGVEMNSVWALLLGRLFNLSVAEAATGALTFAFYPLLLSAVYGWARELKLGQAWALVAAAMVSAIPTAWQSAASGYTDLALTLYLLLTIHAAARWWRTLHPLYLIQVALAVGCALTIKLTAVFAVFPLMLIFLLRARAAQQQSLNHRRLLLAGLLTLAGAGLLGSQWYLRNLVRTGSPVFPFYVSLWKGSAPGWDAARSQMYSVFLANYGGATKGLLDYAATPFYVSLVAQPELNTHYDGVLGISFLLGLPLLLFALRRADFNPELKVTACFCALLFVCWLLTSEQLRFLLPTVTALAVAIVAAAAMMTTESRRNRAGLLAWTLLLSALAGTLVSTAWFLERHPLRAVLGGESRESYLARQLDYYPYYEIINAQLPPSARVWLINMRRDGYHIERPFFSDYLFEDYTLTRQVQAAADLNELRARTRAAGITHLLIRYDVLLDYARSPVVNDRLPEAENQQKMKLLKSFLTEGTRMLKSDQKFMLIELPPA